MGENVKLPNSPYQDLYDEYDKKAGIAKTTPVFQQGQEQNPISPVPLTNITPVTPQQGQEQTPTPTQVSTKPKTAGGGGGGNNQTQGFYSPELEGLQHSMLTKNYLEGSPYADLFKGYMEKAFTPIDTSTLGLSPDQMQGNINTMRANILGSTRALQTQAGEQYGSRGFLPGESGRADTAIGAIGRQGATDLAGQIQNFLTEEAKRKEELGIQAEGINAQKMGVGAQLANVLQSGDLGMINAGLEALRTGGDLEKAIKDYQISKGMLGVQQGQLGLAKNQFDYSKTQDAIKLLMGLYGNEEGQQQQAWQPYWNSILNYGG
jgi:hypothetical protein